MRELARLSPEGRLDDPAHARCPRVSVSLAWRSLLSLSGLLLKKEPRNPGKEGKGWLWSRKTEPAGSSVVEDQIVVELKAVRNLEDIHFVVLRSYLKATGREHGLLLNFAKAALETKRVSRRSFPEGSREVREA